MLDHRHHRHQGRGTGWPTRALFLGGIALALAVAACAPATVNFPPAETQTAPPQATVPESVSPATVSPVPLTPVQPAGPPPSVPSQLTPAVAGPAEISQLLHSVTRYRLSLRDLRGPDAPASQLVNAVQSIAEYMVQVRQVVPQMSEVEQQQSLLELGSLVQEMTNLIESRIAEVRVVGPVVAIRTPEKVQGTPLVVIGQSGGARTSQVHPSAPQQLSQQIGQIAVRAREVLGDQPDGEVVLILMQAVDTVLTTMRQQDPLLSDQELQQLLGELSRATMETSQVLQAYLQPGLVSTPVSQPPTATSVPAPQPQGTPTAAATGTPTPPAAPVQQVPGGQPQQGVQAIQKYGCGACHTIPGVPGQTGPSDPLLLDSPPGLKLPVRFQTTLTT